MGKNNQESKYWLDILCGKIIEKYSDKEIIVASGVSPSGPYHIGSAREVLTADAITKDLVRRGEKAKHLHFVDDHDALKKLYPFLPKKFSNRIGKPLYLIPSPEGKTKNYAQYFFSDFKKALSDLDIEMEVIWVSEAYKKGLFADAIDTALKSRDKIAKILKQVTGRDLDSNWQPIQILDEANQSLTSAKFLSYDSKNKQVIYRSFDNKEKKADIKKGQVRLDWRVDWPVRWAIFGVDVEPFGKDHATKGGSYDSGTLIAKEIFNYPAPYPINYDFINIKGETKKMSSSLGNLVSLKDALKIIPPEILRYFVLRSKPSKQLAFDPGIGMYNLIDEFAKTEIEVLNGGHPEYERSFEMSNLKKDKQTVSKIPFSHLVTCYQSAQKDIKETLVILDRTGYDTETKFEHEIIQRQLKNVDYWLENYAPDSVKFSVKKKLPKFELTSNQKKFLYQLAVLKDKEKNLSALGLHDAIYTLSEEYQLKSNEAFKTIYQLFLGQDWGPKAGFFLVSLDPKFVTNRLKLKQ